MRVLVGYLGPRSAYFRARRPRSWEWDLDAILKTEILHALLNGNWQRGGGRGTRPKRILPPRDDGGSNLDTSVDMKERKAGLDDELARRRAARAKRQQQQGKSRMIAGGGVRNG